MGEPSRQGKLKPVQKFFDMGPSRPQHAWDDIGRAMNGVFHAPPGARWGAPARITQRRNSLDTSAKEPDMASEPAPSLHIEAHHAVGLGLVGTVALPGPFPADGRIFVVRDPGHKGAKGADAKPHYHLKIVQKLSDSHSITRIVALEDVRLLRLNPQPLPPAATSSPAKPAAHPSQYSNDELQKEIAGIPWAQSIKDDRSSYESELFAARTGVVYVPEQAPVLMKFEATVPAAVSLESLVSPTGLCPRTGAAIACPHR
jgi:hypothetical protein